MVSTSTALSPKCLLSSPTMTVFQPEAVNVSATEMKELWLKKYIKWHITLDGVPTNTFSSAATVNILA